MVDQWSYSAVSTYRRLGGLDQVVWNYLRRASISVAIFLKNAESWLMLFSIV